jgi:hypothetical protein
VEPDRFHAKTCCLEDTHHGVIQAQKAENESHLIHPPQDPPTLRYPKPLDHDKEGPEPHLKQPAKLHKRL